MCHNCIAVVISISVSIGIDLAIAVILFSKAIANGKAVTIDTAFATGSYCRTTVAIGIAFSVGIIIVVE